MIGSDTGLGLYLNPSWEPGPLLKTDDQTFEFSLLDHLVVGDRTLSWISKIISTHIDILLLTQVYHNLLV
jgi:hypothetical protein